MVKIIVLYLVYILFVQLTYAKRAGIMRGVLVAIGGAIMWFIIYASYALAFWYGVKLIMDGRETCLLSMKPCFEDDFTNGENQNCGSECKDGFSPASLMVVSILSISGKIISYVAKTQSYIIIHICDSFPKGLLFRFDGSNEHRPSISIR